MQLNGGPLSDLTTSRVPNSENTLSSLGSSVVAEVDLSISATDYPE